VPLCDLVDLTQRYTISERLRRRNH
jgi:hypothetical protein